MAFPTPFTRLTMIWALPEGEQAQCRVHFDGDSDSVVLAELAAAWDTRATTFWNAIKEHYADETSFVGTKAQTISTAGLVLSTIETTLSSPLPGTDTASNLPSEVAIVVSLKTAQAGRSHRGRFYLPATSVGTPTAVGRLLTVTRDDVAAAAAALLQPITAVGQQYECVVASTALQSLFPVTAVRVGNVFDVQRRRRNELVESYVEEPI